MSDLIYQSAPERAELGIKAPGLERRRVSSADHVPRVTVTHRLDLFDLTVSQASNISLGALCFPPAAHPFFPCPLLAALLIALTVPAIAVFDVSGLLLVGSADAL